MSLNLVIVMPAYNEEAVIESVVANWSSFLQTNFREKSALVVVNDGSRDSTGKILDEIAPRYPYLRVVHQKNGGHGNAVVHAYKEAVKLGAEWVFQTDSDDQFISEDVLKLWQKRNESNFILGFRQVRNDAFMRLIITRILKYSMAAVYGTLISDSNIPFRLIKGTFLKKLIEQLPSPTPFAPNIFLAIMARKAGQKTFDIPITHKERMTGEVSIQKMKLLKVCWQSFKELVRFRWELNSKVANLQK